MQTNPNFSKTKEQSNQCNFDFFHELSKDLWSHIHLNNDHDNSIFSEFTNKLEADCDFLEYLHHSLNKTAPEDQNEVIKH